MFTKKISGLRNLPYAQRLAVLNSDSLELRGLKTDLCEVYKIRHGLIDLWFDDFFVRNTGGRTRGHSEKLVVPLNKGRISQRFFSHRVVEKWNALSDHCVTRLSLKSFKASLEDEGLSRYVITFFT